MLISIYYLKKKNKLSYILFLILFFIVIVAAGYYLWRQYSYQMETKQKLQTELNNVKIEKVTLETAAKESTSNDAVTQLQAAIQWANDNQSSTYSLLQNISSLLPERGFIMDFSFQEDGAVSLSVQFDSAREAAYYLKSLSKATFIKQADLLNITTETPESDTVVDEYAVLPRYTADYQLQIDPSKLKQKGEVAK